MSYLRINTSILRKVILIGWALTVIWIYLGNLVNFHQHHIWGKQLIPVACASTRVKEKDSASVVKNNSNSKSFDSTHHFDFISSGQQVSDIADVKLVIADFKLSDAPVLKQEIQDFSLRSPPSVQISGHRYCC